MSRIISKAVLKIEKIERQYAKTIDDLVEVNRGLVERLDELRDKQVEITEEVQAIQELLEDSKGLQDSLTSIFKTTIERAI